MDTETYLGCSRCPKTCDPRFDTGELVTADQLLASNAILAERLALAVSPMVQRTGVNVMADLSLEDIDILSGAYDLLQDLAKPEKR